MKCRRPDLSEKLVLYVEHLLDEKERKELDSHISECELCRDEAQALSDNIGMIKLSASSKSGAPSPSPCPDERMLVEFSESPDLIAPGDRKKLEAHLKGCLECQSILESLREMSAELGDYTDAADSTAKMPEVMKARISSLYGKESTEPGGLVDILVRFFRKPKYSIISALAALLLIVGAFTLMIGEMTGRQKAEMPAPSSTQTLTMRPDDGALKGGRRAGYEGGLSKEEAADSSGLSNEKTVKSDMQSGLAKMKAAETEKERLAFTDREKDLAGPLKGRAKSMPASPDNVSADKKMAAGEAFSSSPAGLDRAPRDGGAGAPGPEDRIAAGPGGSAANMPQSSAGSMPGRASGNMTGGMPGGAAAGDHGITHGHAPGGAPVKAQGNAPSAGGYGAGGGSTDESAPSMQPATGAGQKTAAASRTENTGNLVVGGSQNIQAQQYARPNAAAEDKGGAPAQPPASPSSSWVAGKTAPAPASAPKMVTQAAPSVSEPSKQNLARAQGAAAESKKLRAREQESMERELTAAGQGYIDRAIGPDKARITVTVTTEGDRAPLEVKKINVVIRSTCALSDSEKASLAQGISEKLKLQTNRDTVHIEVSPSR
jgi:hypothetical protein